MAQEKISEIIHAALPASAQREFKDAYEGRKHATNQAEACISALGECHSLNWQAYLECYPDVDKNNPIRHFVQHGIFEGRKLFATASFGFPKVSVVVSNRNNAIFLPYCLGRLTSQTLRDIEIIVVDDSSDDDSVKILHKLAKADERIKLIRHKECQSLHMARKTGVKEASGRFIMFLDSDDYYTNDACEKAWHAILSGYDIVCFGVNVIPLPSLNSRVVKDAQFSLNDGQSGKYEGKEIYEALFRHNVPARTLWCKIYDANIVKAAFAEMADCSLPSAQDVYEIAVIAARAKSMLKINDKLYCYRLGSGKTTTTDMKILLTSDLDATRIAKPLADFLRKSGLYEYNDFLMKNIYKRVIDSFVYNVSPSSVTYWFNAVTANLGILKVIYLMHTLAGDNIMRIARAFKSYESDYRQHNSLIGIHVQNGAAPPVVSRLIFLANFLHEKCFKVTVFTEMDFDELDDLPQEINVLHISYTRGEDKVEHRFDSFLRGVNLHHVDIMLCSCSYADPNQLWRIMLLKYLGISPIFLPEEKFFERQDALINPYDLETQLMILSGYDKVITLSSLDTVFLHINGIDAATNTVPYHIGGQPNDAIFTSDATNVPLDTGYEMCIVSKDHSECDCNGNSITFNDYATRICDLITTYRIFSEIDLLNTSDYNTIMFTMVYGLYPSVQMSERRSETVCICKI